ncbi:MAG: hypothetical protein OXT65_04445 [Alphaproteobacteria bacterium]|nr:hypothetical protein [Alphaproteobacteria bacterium]
MSKLTKDPLGNIMTRTNYETDNDYTLRVTTTSGGSNNNQVITRLFNFLSAEITTIVTESKEDRNCSRADSLAVSTSSHIRNFNDLTSTREIELMHQKLKETGGTPPPLDEVLESCTLPKPKKLNVLPKQG